MKGAGGCKEPRKGLNRRHTLQPHLSDGQTKQGVSCICSKAHHRHSVFCHDDDDGDDDDDDDDTRGFEDDDGDGKKKM